MPTTARNRAVFQSQQGFIEEVTAPTGYYHRLCPKTGRKRNYSSVVVERHRYVTIQSTLTTYSSDAHRMGSRAHPDIPAT